MYTICLPFQFSCIHHEQTDQRAAGLASLRATWEAVLRGEAWQTDVTLPMGTRKLWGQVMADLIWNEGQVSREIYCACEAAGWDFQNEELRIFAYVLFAVPANTKYHLEDAFSHLADICKRFARHGKLTRSLDFVFELVEQATYSAVLL